MGTTQKIHQEKTKVVLAETVNEPNKAQDLFWERECRATEAGAMLALVRRIVAPDDSDKVDNDLLSRLNVQERHGLAFVLDVIGKSMEENSYAICDCYEKSKCRD
jgi:hypothetical protein